MNIFVCKYRQNKAKKDFMLIPVKSITGSDVVVVVSGQNFPQSFLFSWSRHGIHPKGDTKDFGPRSPRGAETLMGKTALVAASSSIPRQLSSFPLAIPVPEQVLEKRRVNAKINAVFSF